MNDTLAVKLAHTGFKSEANLAHEFLTLIILRTYILLIINSYDSLKRYFQFEHSLQYPQFLYFRVRI